MYRSIIFVMLLFASCQSCREIADKTEVTEIDETTALQPVTSHTKMAFINGGTYLPFYGSDSLRVTVKPFLLDEHPVTNAQFLDFVKANPARRKSNIRRLFADTTYLRDWPDDLHYPIGQNADAPVCYVSWFAAKAYAKSAGKRLPTTDEWEFVAMADETDLNARSKKSYSDNIVSLYLKKDKQLQPVKKSQHNAWNVYNMFDLVWEWTDDFNSVLTTGDSRAGEFDDKNLFCAAAATSATDVLNYAAFMRFGLRSSLKANYTVGNLGFRCARDTNLIIK